MPNKPYNIIHFVRNYGKYVGLHHNSSLSHNCCRKWGLPFTVIYLFFGPHLVAGLLNFNKHKMGKLIILIFVVFFVAIAKAQTDPPTTIPDTTLPDTTIPDTTIPSATTTAPPTTTKVVTTSPPVTTSPSPTSSCILADPANTSALCPGMPNGIFYPSTRLFGLNNPTPYAFYNRIFDVTCKVCKSKISIDYACSLMYTLYSRACGAENSAPALGIKYRTACRYDCLGLNLACTQTNGTFTSTPYWDCGAAGAGNSLYLTCPNVDRPSDDSCCQSNRKGDKCHIPSWINTSTYY